MTQGADKTGGGATPSGDQPETGAAKHAEPDNAQAGSNTAVPVAHDRVAMLTLRPDGTPDQTNPEFIDPASALAATAEQFKQQAVSAVDTDARRQQPADEPEAVQDPTVAALAEAHESAAAEAESAAAKAVADLTGEQPPTGASTGEAPAD